ncbi:hypothetical protein CR956_00640 [Candidatus Saccharibacteria bacterium]|nr:MAG: hypothetical protein CR956_00640 [Candidatus Saccharibacteria bacterium]
MKKQDIKYTYSTSDEEFVSGLATLIESLTDHPSAQYVEDDRVVGKELVKDCFLPDGRQCLISIGDHIEMPSSGGGLKKILVITVFTDTARVDYVARSGILDEPSKFEVSGNVNLGGDLDIGSLNYIHLHTLWGVIMKGKVQYEEEEL